MSSMSRPAVEITLHFKETAECAAEWAEYHHDTYGFELVSAEGMSCVVVPDGETSMDELTGMLSEDFVHHTVMEAP